MSINPDADLPKHIPNNGRSVARVRLTLLGPGAITSADGCENALFRKDAAMLAVLALDGPQAPQRLWALRWPASSTKQAGDSLRQRAAKFKHDAKAMVLLPGSPVRLADAIDVDLNQIDNLDDDALCSARGLLAGVDIGDLSELDQWLAGARQRVDDRLDARLAERAQALEREGRLDAALRLTQRLTDRRPLDELAWHQHISLLYLIGNRSLALETYYLFNTRVRTEHGMPPSLAMQRLAHAIEASGFVPAGARHPPPVTLQHPPVLVGRDAAWAAMAGAWHRQQPFLVVGGAGMGKSRLLQDFTRGRDGVWTEQAQPGDAGIPYALLGRLLVELDRAYRPELTDLQRSELARLRPEFGSKPATPPYPPMLWDAAQALITSATGRGLRALILDDLHYADAASLDALRWLGSSRHLRALPLGLASRPGWAADSPLAAWLEDSQRPLRIDLRALTQDELMQLLATLALPSLVDAAVGAWLFRLAGGHPLYSLAALRSALGPGGNLAAMDATRPTGIEHLLDARLRDLPPTALELAQVAAVAGADFSAELAASVLERPMLALIDAWAVLEAADVFSGRSFGHDLMQEAALRAVPAGIANALHRRIAGWLQQQPHPVAARVAAHWDAGERPADAGCWWHLAGEAAGASGSLGEQITMFERAAACHALAGAADARFESSFACLPALKLRHGGGAVIQALPDIEARAGTRAQRLRCALARAEALLDVERGPEALAVAAAAVAEAAPHGALLADAHALHADALAQCGKDADAQAAAAAALEAAEQTGDGRQRLRALNALRFVHYAGGRLREAVQWARQVVVQAETLGDRSEAAAAEGNFAALLASVGDVPGTYAHAMACRTRHAEIGMAQHSTAGVVNKIVLGAAAAALGRFDEAIDELQAAIAQCGGAAAAGARAKARLVLANVWLTLGRPDLACADIESLPLDILPGMQMQAELVRARAALQVGGSPRRHFQELARLARENPAPALVQSAWWEWSWIDTDPQAVIAKLAEVRAQCEALGLVGTAWSFGWRQLVRWLDIDGAQAGVIALEHARALEPHALSGTSAKCHPPLTLTTLAEAYFRAGDEEAAQRCNAAAFGWLDQAWPHVPETHRNSFVRSHLIHRAWWAQRAP